LIMGKGELEKKGRTLHFALTPNGGSREKKEKGGGGQKRRTGIKTRLRVRPKAKKGASLSDRKIKT